MTCTRYLLIRMSVNKKVLQKTKKNICVTRISNPANGARVAFEKYN